ncbi:MAG: cell division ATPase MinD [archaeon]|nr:cell division ATPase MinD [archaeon]
MSRVITVASGKGGVGKTTITANLGIALAQRGQRILLIDADIAMANLSLILGMHSSPITLHDVLLGESSIQDAIYDGPAGISFVPSGLSLESYRRVDSERLEQVVESIKDQFDFILLDAPAGIEKNVTSCLAASDQVLLVSSPDSPSVADVLKTKITAQRIGVAPLGIILNFVRGEKGEIPQDDIMKMLELPLYGVVPFDDEVRKSFMQEKVQPLILRKPNSPAAIAIRKIAAKLDGMPIEFKNVSSGSFIGRFFNSLFSIFRRTPKQNVQNKREEDISEDFIKRER